MSNLRKVEKFTVKIEESKPTPHREKLARMFGVGGFEDAPGNG